MPHPVPARPAARERRRMAAALAALLGVVGGSTLGYTLLEPGWDVWQSLYFTLITITTVGYGDYGLSPAGKGFTSVVLVAGIATATYAFGQFVQAVVAHQTDWRYRMQQRIDQLSEHQIICGVGRLGRVLCQRLSQQGVEYVIVENNPHQAARAREHGCLVVEGNASEDEVLQLAGVERARGLVAATSNDAENLVITLTAHDLNPQLQIISRAGDFQSMQRVRRAGASQVVTPAIQCGAEIARMLTQPHLAPLLADRHRADAHYLLRELQVADAPQLCGRTLRAIGHGHPEVVFVAVRGPDGATRMRPGGEYVFAGDDVLVVAGTPDRLAALSPAAADAAAASLADLPPAAPRATTAAVR